MKISKWLLLFFLALLTDLILIQSGKEELRCFSKPLIMPLLGIYFFLSIRASISALMKWILLALLFSWIGDVLLMFQAKNELFFLGGLSSFLLAHVFFIVVFHHIRIREGIKSNIWFLLIVVIYYAILIAWLSPHLGDKKLAVRIYGIVISFMLMMALHMSFIKNKRAGLFILSGAILFVLSDSILAIDKFYSSFELAGICIMLTYGIAQFLIVRGMILYIQQSNSD